TISGNTANTDPIDLGGGGILNGQGGAVNLTNSTISNNSGRGGGGIYNNNGTVNVRNTIIALNTVTGSGPDFSGTLSSFGYNLIGNGSGATIAPKTGDQIGVTAAQLNLGPLQPNGSPTQTHALLTNPTVSTAHN